ncbi:NUMOD4 domain-containing protein [Lactiplantibacillus pentosus]|uniref:NUMOD4 domain-containing protein n=1 Tax=Lactiplantibacillus pentosus TaxID=1589 RepID=UPI00345E84BF
MTKANSKVIEAEIWRDVAGYNESYQVSSLGRVRSTDRVIKLSNGNQRHLIGHLIQPHDNGEVVLKAESMTKMAELLGVSQTAISAHVNSGKPLSTGLTVVRDNETDKQVETKEVA